MNIRKSRLAFAFLAAATVLSSNAAEGYKDTALIPDTKWHIHDPDRPQPRIIKPGEKFSEQAPAPADAIVLFDGKDFSKWSGQGNAEPKWKIENGYMETTPRGGRIRTKDEFSDFQLHLEFATPEKVEGKGQGRGNNGVSIFGLFEIQILDSYGNETYPDGQAGAIYGQKPPLVNASRGPGQWQTYDIIFEAPRFDDKGELTKKANVTVIHNGVVLHHKQEFHGPTTHKAIGKYNSRQTKGPIDLYEHGNPVRFRNIWVRPLGEYDKP